MAKYRQIIRVICFVLLLVGLILKAILFLDNNLVTNVIYPFSLIALWLMLDRYVLKDHTKHTKLTNIKLTKHAKVMYWTLYIIGFVIFETVKFFKINLYNIPFAFIICGAEFKEEIITWLYKKLSIKKTN